SQQSKQESDHHSHRQWSEPHRLALLKPPNCVPVLEGGGHVDNDPENHQGRSRPQGQSRVLMKRLTLHGGYLPQEYAEPGHDESESHHRQARAHPGKQCPLRGQIDSGIKPIVPFHAVIRHTWSPPLMSITMWSLAQCGTGPFRALSHPAALYLAEVRIFWVPLPSSRAGQVVPVTSRSGWREQSRKGHQQSNPPGACSRCDTAPSCSADHLITNAPGCQALSPTSERKSRARARASPGLAPQGIMRCADCVSGPMSSQRSAVFW